MLIGSTLIDRVKHLNGKEPLHQLTFIANWCKLISAELALGIFLNLSTLLIVLFIFLRVPHYLVLFLRVPHYLTRAIPQSSSSEWSDISWGSYQDTI